MNPDELEQFQQQLRQLPLRRPSAELDARIALLARPAVAVPTRGRFAATALAAAAVAASLLLVVAWHDDPAPIKPPRGLPAESMTRTDRRPEPVRIEQVWYAPSRGEVVSDGDGPPKLRLCRQMVRHVRLVDDHRHVVIEWNISGQQSALVPLEFN